MNADQLKEVPPIGAVKEALEIRPDAKYLLHIKTTVDEYTHTRLQEAFGERFPNLTVFCSHHDLALYEIEVK